MDLKNNIKNPEEVFVINPFLPKDSIKKVSEVIENLDLEDLNSAYPASVMEALHTQILAGADT